jgi:hypothetical protein
MKFAEIFRKYYTDKVVQKDELHSGHRYDITYSNILDSIRNNINTFLEIGIGLGDHYAGRNKVYPDYKHGSSLLAWSEYLPNASVYGWDIHKCNNIDNPRIKTCLLDATSEKQVSNFFLRNNIKFDLIIDDGSHWENDQVKSFMLLHSKLNKEGLYIIEDILPQFQEGFKTLKNFPKDFVDNIINKNFEITYHDTREISGIPNDFCVCFKRK